jgi:hypothetical protein
MDEKRKRYHWKTLWHTEEPFLSLSTGERETNPFLQCLLELHQKSSPSSCPLLQKKEDIKETILPR